MIEIGKRWRDVLSDVPDTRKDDTVVNMPDKARERLLADIKRKQNEIIEYKKARQLALDQIAKLRQKAEQAAQVNERELVQAREDLHAMQDVLAKVMFPYFETDEENFDHEHPAIRATAETTSGRSSHSGD